MPVKLKDNVTGEVTQREVVDAREILKMKDKKGASRYSLLPIVSGPQNIEHVVEEFAREPVGTNVPRPPTDEDEVVKIRNPVSDQPRMAREPKAGVAGQVGVAFDRDTEKEQLESMTVAELRETAENESADLGDATLKADIIRKMLNHRKKAAEAAGGGAAAEEN